MQIENDFLKVPPPRGHDDYFKISVNKRLVDFPQVIFFPLAVPVANGILVLWPGVKPMAPTVEVRYLNHWTAKGAPSLDNFWENSILYSA